MIHLCFPLDEDVTGFSTYLHNDDFSTVDEFNQKYALNPTSYNDILLKYLI